MYVGHVNLLTIECSVVENASTGDDICDKVAEIIGGVDGARGPIGEAVSGDNSSDPEDVIKPKNKNNCNGPEEGSGNGESGSKMQN